MNQSNADLVSAPKQRALITGGGRGIGAAIAQALASAGHEIILNYRRNDAAARATQQRIEAAGGSAVLSRFDVMDVEAVHQALQPLLADERPIGILVNNAGLTRDAPFAALASADWERVTRTALDGFYNVTRLLVMPMVRQRWGRIINVSSYSGVVGNRGQVHYSAAKAGLIGATKALAKELAPRSITVNAVAPGLIDTSMARTLPLKEVVQQIPMRRLGKPEEVAKLVAFLCSADADYITGQVIGINGGLI
jgi:3-oxoacyl-[acyl-carrier protein] reductase